jgi:hypothetical protein
MLVERLVVLSVPWIVFESDDEAITEPDTARFTGESGMRSTKLVSTRLNPTVCEFAMFPEMFSNA